MTSDIDHRRPNRWRLSPSHAPIVVVLLATVTICPIVASEGLQQIRGSGEATFRISDAALLLGGQTGGAIAIRVSTSVSPVQPNAFQIIVGTEIDLATLDLTPETALIGLETFVYAVDSEARVIDRASETLRLDSRQTMFRVEDSALKIVVELETPPGNYQIRSLVRQTDHDRYGLSSTRLSIPEVDGDRKAISTPWLGDTGEGWIMVTPSEGLSPASASIYMFDSAGELRSLTAQPILAPGEPLTGSVIVTGSSAEGGDLVATVLRSDGVPVAEVPIDTVGLFPTEVAATARLVFEVTPPDLPPATYGLFLAVRRDGVSGATSTAVPFTMIETDTSSAMDRWTELDPDPLEPLTTPAPIPPRPVDPRTLERSVEVSEEEIIDTFLRVFELLADGARIASRNTLRVFETESLRDRSPAAIGDLEKRQMKALQQLANREAFSPLPIAVVYGELIGEYHRRGLAPLSEHALKMSTELTEPIARRSRGDLSDALAADVLVSIGGFAILARRSSVGEELLRAALKIDPTHLAALMSLGASLEQLGNYREASRVFDDLVKAHPSSREGSLRLAVNLERLKETDRAMALYTSLVDAGVGDWIEVVATDQTAALEARSGLLDRAEGRLRAAIDRFPEIASLRVQLAWILDTSGQFEPAGEVVEALVAGLTSASESPRYRYNHWHSFVFDESRTTIGKLVATHAQRFDQASAETEQEKR